jgi:hypothetical protein
MVYLNGCLLESHGVPEWLSAGMESHGVSEGLSLMESIVNLGGCLLEYPQPWYA